MLTVSLCVKVACFAPALTARLVCILPVGRAHVFTQFPDNEYVKCSSSLLSCDWLVIVGSVESEVEQLAVMRAVFFACLVDFCVLQCLGFLCRLAFLCFEFVLSGPARRVATCEPQQTTCCFVAPSARSDSFCGSTRACQDQRCLDGLC